MRRMRLRPDLMLGLACLLVSWSIIGVARAQQPLSAPLAAQLESIAAAEYAKQPLGALSVGLVRDGILAWEGHYGKIDIDGAQRPTRTTRYRIGSVTKQFTALMLLQLVEAGTVHLSDPVANYLPEVDQIQGRSPTSSPITLQQLANHTSGLPVEASNMPVTAFGSPDSWQDSLFAALRETRYAFEPGTRYHYSNIDYAVLGAALSRAAQVPYLAFVHQHILEPLNMVHTSFVTAADDPQLAKGYVLQNGIANGTLPQREQTGRGYRVPGGGAYSTLEDLARFCAFEQGFGPEAVLRKDSLRARRDLPVVSDPNLSGGYGVGFQIFPGDGISLQGHLGGIAGYRALNALDPASGYGIVILRNMSGDAIDLLALGKAVIKTARDWPSVAAKP